MAKREFLRLADHSIASMTWPVGLYPKSWTALVASGTAASPVACPTEQVPWASIIDPKTGKKKSQAQAPVNRPVGPLRQSNHGPGLVAQSACRPAHWMESCGPDGQVSTVPLNLRWRHPGGAFRQDRLRGLFHPAAGHNLGTGKIKNANMVCNVDYLTIEAWIRQRLNSRGGRFDGPSRPEALPGRRLQVPGRPIKASARDGPCSRGPGKHRCFDLLSPPANEADRHSEARPTAKWKPTCNGCSTRAARAW